MATRPTVFNLVVQPLDKRSFKYHACSYFCYQRSLSKGVLKRAARGGAGPLVHGAQVAINRALVIKF